MTSEVLLMNRGAVAMAADSAVTISSRDSQTIYQSVDKVFQLIEGQPVGVMIYNHADIMNVPWETVITLYRAKSGNKKFATVEEYAEDFLRFIQKSDDLFPPEHQDLEFYKTVAIVFGLLADEFDDQVANFREASNEEVGGHYNSIFKFVVGEIHRAYEAYFDDSPREDLTCFPPDMGKKLRSRYEGQVDELISGLMGHLSADYTNLSVSPDLREKLQQIAVMAVTKNAFFEGYTGIVFAGFGQRDKFPAMISYHTGGVFGGILKKAPDRRDAIEANTGPVVMTFAQDKMIHTFMTGIDRDFRLYLFIETLKLTHQLVADLISGLPALDKNQKQQLYNQYSEENLSAALIAFFQKVEEYQRYMHTSPIFRAIHTLPRQELAETAASLVKLNSFQQKVMQEPETVGGPVDVALISLSEGLVLIRDGGSI